MLDEAAEAFQRLKPILCSALILVGWGSILWEVGPFDRSVRSDVGGGGFSPCRLLEGPGAGFGGGGRAAGC